MVLEKRVPISSVSKASYMLGVLMPKHNAPGAIRGHCSACDIGRCGAGSYRLRGH
jgi:hypothetical protein